jgi:hypothetical protein
MWNVEDRNLWARRCTSWLWVTRPQPCACCVARMSSMQRPRSGSCRQWAPSACQPRSALIETLHATRDRYEKNNLIPGRQIAQNGQKESGCRHCCRTHVPSCAVRLCSTRHRGPRQALIFASIGVTPDGHEMALLEGAAACFAVRLALVINLAAAMWELVTRVIITPMEKGPPMIEVTGRLSALIGGNVPPNFRRVIDGSGAPLHAIAHAVFRRKLRILSWRRNDTWMRAMHLRPAIDLTCNSWVRIRPSKE